MESITNYEELPNIPMEREVHIVKLLDDASTLSFRAPWREVRRRMTQNETGLYFARTPAQLSFKPLWVDPHHKQTPTFVDNPKGTWAAFSGASGRRS